MRTSILIAIIVLFGSCSKVQKRNDIKEFFDEYGVEGCFLLYNANTKKYISYNDKRAKTGFLPASTFKITNTLIGLETGVIKDTSNFWIWDNQERDVKVWNKDQTLTSAFQYSCVPAYQQLARDIGLDNMLHHMSKLNYGNFDITEKNLDTFWLFGNSRVSCYDQISLLENIVNYNTHFSISSCEILEDIMIIEENQGYTLRAKTGWATQDEMQIGWFVGTVEKNYEYYIFALNIEKKEGDSLFRTGRKNITLNILNYLEVFK